MKRTVTALLAIACLAGCARQAEMELGMIKLYRQTDPPVYWETWESNGVHTIHWGTLGTQGQSKELRNSMFRSASKSVNAEIEKRKAEGYQEIPIEEHAVLLIEYPVAGMGTPEDLEKRHALQGRMDETLGWTGLGHCDGGSIGSGTMEVCCLVVDFEIAKGVIEKDLKETEFADFSRIYREDE